MKKILLHEYESVLLATPLFAGIAPADIPRVVACLQGEVRGWAKGEFLFFEGDAAGRVGLVLAGGVRVLREDYFGRREIVAEINTGELFAETFAYAAVEKMPVSVQAAQESDVLLFEGALVGAQCAAGCDFHSLLTANMLAVLAGKNVALNAKLELLSKRSTREKLLSYLATQAKQAGRPTFTIPFSRQELADYLSADRSALCTELSRMQKEGLVQYKRNVFRLPDSALPK